MSSPVDPLPTCPPAVEAAAEQATDRVSAETALRRSEEDFRTLTSHVPGVLYRLLITPQRVKRYTFVSEGVRTLYGVTPQAVMADGELLGRMRHRGDYALLRERWQAAIAADQTLDVAFRIVLADGTRKWVQMTSSVVSHDARGVVRVGVALDITARTLAEAALRDRDKLWKLALESTGDGAWDWNLVSGVETFSARFCEMYGFAEDELPALAATFDQRTHPDDRERMLRARQSHFDGSTPAYVSEHRIQCKDGSWKWILARGLVIGRDEQGRPTRMVGTHTDIGERKKSEALIWHQANFDPLTGLPNRRMLHDRLEQAIKKTRRARSQLALLFIDLDHFKQVNDSVGHAMGDQLLVRGGRADQQLCARCRYRGPARR